MFLVSFVPCCLWPTIHGHDVVPRSKGILQNQIKVRVSRCNFFNRSCMKIVGTNMWFWPYAGPSNGDIVPALRVPFGDLKNTRADGALEASVHDVDERRQKWRDRYAANKDRINARRREDYHRKKAERQAATIGVDVLPPESCVGIILVRCLRLCYVQDSCTTVLIIDLQVMLRLLVAQSLRMRQQVRYVPPILML